MIRRLGLVYRKDKSLSKAASGFVKVTLANASEEFMDQTQERYRTALGASER
jgi:hypothetical protein